MSDYEPTDKEIQEELEARGDDLAERERGYASMNEIQAAALLSKHSKYWFSPETLAFFNSGIEAGPFHGRYFVTSERRELNLPKRYTIRECVDGEINDVSEFQEHATLAAALEAIPTPDLVSEPLRAASNRLRAVVDRPKADAYKAGVWDQTNHSADQKRLVYDGTYRAGVYDTEIEQRELEDRCSNGCVCTTLDRINAENPLVGVLDEGDLIDGPSPREAIWVRFIVRRDPDGQPSEPEQFLQYLVEMLELPQPTRSLVEEGYVIVGADVYGVDS